MINIQISPITPIHIFQDNRNIFSYLDDDQFIKEVKTVVFKEFIEVHCVGTDPFVKLLNGDRMKSGFLEIVDHAPGYFDVLQKYEVEFSKRCSHGLDKYERDVFVYKILRCFPNST